MPLSKDVARSTPKRGAGIQDATVAKLQCRQPEISERRETVAMALRARSASAVLIVSPDPMQPQEHRAGPAHAVDTAPEKQFYLEEFRGRTLLIAVAAEEAIARSAAWPALGEVVRDLVQNDSRVLLLVGCEDLSAGTKLVQQQGLSFPLAPELFSSVEESGSRLAVLDPSGDHLESTNWLARAWRYLRDERLFVVLVPQPEHTRFAWLAAEVAAKLRVHKLVLAESEGGIADPKGAMIPFMDRAMLDAVLAVGQAEWAGLGHRRALFAAIRQALQQGVGSVNLCRLSGLAEELFTYTGSGTLFTASDYCSVERLGIDDFAEVERLLSRGVREGVLKPRTEQEIARFLFQAYGAVVGRHHLAGVCALETELYRADRAGEIVGLYTITRFKGEGIGRKLLARVLADARALGLDYVFACTTVPSAEAFFLREGFRKVGHDEVPKAKWQNYPASRRQRVVALRLDLEVPREA
ncbi:MAG: hypothetical protein KatS3mg077_2118 [Candidatus Binatia bacterium]|nr:MAG: hypothetical protein KatS3mg077_2118 [Candidatus Binatia bacterium]